jgi:predicted AlkP superfamily phosphohydrolase/phosphomutase
MSARHLIIGLDGADLRLIHTFGRRRLPALFQLMDSGVTAAQRSVQPPATLPNWTTFLTGVNPGVHGVFDFTTRHGYSVRFDGGSVRAVPTWLARLDALGEACACVGFPGTYPPERLRHGLCISGWDAPVSFEADASFVWPRAVYAQLTRRFGALSFDEVNQFRTDDPFWHDALGERLAAKVARRAQLAEHLLAMRRWHTFAFYFGESDTASHYLYSLFDEDSPRRPAQVRPAAAEGLERVYVALDRAVAQLVQQAGDAAEITVVSDHGSGGSSDQVLYLNRALAALGFLTWKRQHRGRPVADRLKAFALGQLPPRLRQAVFRVGGTALPSWLESRVRFGAIDMGRTRAFSDELNYFPGIYLNQRGREPRGIVAPEQREQVLHALTAALRTLRCPTTHAPLVSEVWRREALFEGPLLTRAPDLLLELATPQGYALNLQPSASAPHADGHLLGRIAPHEYLGKKGRSLPGSHRPHGLYIAAGPSVRARGRVELGIEDAAVVTLARMGLEPPALSRGCVPAGLLGQGELHVLPEAHPQPSKAQTHVGVIARLRALGYVD